MENILHQAHPADAGPAGPVAAHPAPAEAVQPGPVAAHPAPAEVARPALAVPAEEAHAGAGVHVSSEEQNAEIAGLKSNDKVLAINSVKLTGAQYNEMSSLLRNEELNVFKFLVLRKNKILNINVKRTYRQLSHVQYNAVAADKNYGLITLTKFNRGACSGVADKIALAKKNKIEGLILDLRDNPGGQLDEASCVAGLFLGKKFSEI